jgi:hypothetical protein
MNSTVPIHLSIGFFTEMSLLIKGLRMYLHPISSASTNPTETRIGLAMVIMSMDSCETLFSPKSEMTRTIARPITSSNIAALVATIPRRVMIKFVLERMVKVVPRLVALSAAPAAKACSGLAATSFMSIKDSAIGTAIPVNATDTEMVRFGFKEESEAESPPDHQRAIRSYY